MTKTGVAYLAASFLTSRNVDGVATDYLAWVDEQSDEGTAVDALLAASRSSKNPNKVLINAGDRYAEFSGDSPLPPSAPEVTAVTPDEGDVEGGTVVTVSGTALTGATEVAFAGVAGTNLTLVSDTELTVTTPAGEAGLVDVTVTTPAGTDTATGAFEYTSD